MRLAKRLLLTGSLALVLILGALVGTWFYIGQPGSTRIEAWIGSQIIAILGNYITPKVAFTDLDYRRPRTVVLKNLSLTRDGQLLASVDEMLLELAEVPREGEPLKIERIELDKPYIALELRPDGEMVGWSGFVRPEVLREPESVPQGQRFSDVLVLRQVRIRNGEVRYRGPEDSEPMILPGIDLTLGTAPDAAEPGWYRLAGALKRDPILSLDMDGRLNLDTGLLELGAFKLAATLGEEQYGTLPPPLQQILRRHEAQGQLAATFKGNIPLLDPAGIEGEATAQFKDVRLKFNEAALACRNVQLKAGLPDAPVKIELKRGTFRNAELTLISAERVATELPGLPQGFPITVNRFEADGPVVRLIHNPAGGFVGWNWLSGDATAESPAATSGKSATEDGGQETQATRPAESLPAGETEGGQETQPSNDEGGQDARPPGEDGGQDARPPSDEGAQDARPPGGESPSTQPMQKVHSLANRFVRIREGDIRNGTFVYGVSGGRPLTLRSIQISLKPPSEGGGKGQAVTASARSTGLFHTSLTGRLDLAGLLLDLERFSFQTSVKGEAQYALLPDTIGDLFRRHGITGNLSFTFQGQVPLTRVTDSVGQARVNLRRTRLNFAGVSMPVERAVLNFDLPVNQIKADVSGLALVGDDLSMLEVERIEFDLANPPRANGPLEVRTARFTRPRLSFVQAADEKSGLLGWRRLGNSESPSSSESSSSPPARLSDFARFEQLLISQGEVLYDDNDGQGDPMMLSGIDMEFRIPPLQDAPGWYHLAASIRREGLFDIDLDGRIDADAFRLELNRLQLEGQLGEGQYSMFPPALQHALRQHEVRGKLSLTARGTFPLIDMRKTEASIGAQLTEGHVAFDQTVCPINRVTLDAALNPRGVSSRYDAILLGGSISGNVNLSLDRPYPLGVTWNAVNTRMEETLRVVQGGDPQYAGLLDTHGNFSIHLEEGIKSLHGSGTIQVRKGKLIRLPVIHAIAKAVSKATLGLVHTRSDSASAKFQLRPTHVQVDDLRIDSEMVDLRASGRINYDATVDLRATAHAAAKIGRELGTGIGRAGEVATLGKLKHFSQEMGNLFGDVSDALAVGESIVSYRVTGPLSNPKVEVVGPVRK